MPRRKYLPRLRGPVIQPASPDPRGTPVPAPPRPSAPSAEPRTEHPPAFGEAAFSPSPQMLSAGTPLLSQQRCRGWPPLPSSQGLSRPTLRRAGPAEKRRNPAPDTRAPPGCFAPYQPSRRATLEPQCLRAKACKNPRREGAHPAAPAPGQRCYA